MEQEMEALSLVNQLSQYLETLLMVNGHFNGLGLEEPLLLEITIHALMSPFLEAPTLLLHQFLSEETTQTLEHRSASSSTPTSFTSAQSSLAISHCSLDSRLVSQLSFKLTSMDRLSQSLLELT